MSKKTLAESNNSTGFTLVELMITMGLLGAIVYGVMQVNQMMATSQTKYSSESEFLIIQNEINAILSNPTNCLATFSPNINAKNTPSGTIANIKNNGIAKYSIGTPIGSASVVINSYALSDSDPDVEVATEQSTKLLINFKRKKLTPGIGDITRKIKLNVSVDGAGNITACRSLSSSSDIWTRGSGSDIYYNGGKVGIGTSAPISYFELANDNVGTGLTNDIVYSRYENTDDWAPLVFRRSRGSLSTPKNLQNGDYLGGLFDIIYVNGVWTDTSGIKTRYLGDGTTNLSTLEIITSGQGNRLYIASNGNIGVGHNTPQAKLDIAGDVKIGTSAEACTADKRGSIKYDAGSDNMQFCSNSGWKSMNSNIEYISSNTGFDGQTGETACASKGKKCAQVVSLNTVWDNAGCDPMHCMRVCMTWYNQSLPGIPNRMPNAFDSTNPVIHSCGARIGAYTTYLHSGVIRCGGYFAAICY